jgi:hypothetical protein
MRRIALALVVAALAAVAAFRACREAAAPPPGERRPPSPAPSPPAAASGGEPSEVPAARKVVDVPPPRLAPPGVVPSPHPVPIPAASPSLWGAVTLMGPRPSRQKIRMTVDPKCEAMHAEPILSDELVVGPVGQVRWAVAYVTKGLGERRFEPPTTPVQLDQIGCRYVPHVLGVQVEQPVSITNRDPLLHNVHALPFANREFGLGQLQGVEMTRTFARTEFVKVRCDVHPWMLAWIGVFDHPYFSVTDEEGVYRIAGLTPGRYQIAVWHEGLKTEAMEVDVPGDVDVRRDFLLQRR